MRVILIMTVTADGFITRTATEDASWVEAYDKLFFDEKTRDIGTVILGANTFKLLPEPFAGRLNIVLSTTGDTSRDVPGSVEWYTGELTDLLGKLEQRGIESVALIGGSQVNGSFLIENLVDEVYLMIAPMFFGQGVPLSSGFDLETKLTLVDTTRYDNGVVLLHYEVEKNEG